jgi:hypothetical protein
VTGDPCRDEGCELEGIHPSHVVARKRGPRVGKRKYDRRSRLRAARKRKHAAAIAKLKKLQAANNRRILLGR